MLRYGKQNAVGSALDPLDDMREFVSFYTSLEFTEHVAIDLHGASSGKDAKARAEVVGEHVSLALEFIDLALTQPASVAALVAAYYAGLNLMKGCVGFTDCFEALADPNHASHGVQRIPVPSTAPPPPAGPGFLSESLVIHPKGSLALIYRALTGDLPTQSSVKIPSRDVFAQIHVVGAEVARVGLPSLRPLLSVRFQELGGERIAAEFVPSSPPIANGPPPVLKPGWLYENTSDRYVWTCPRPVRETRRARLEEAVNTHFLQLSPIYHRRDADAAQSYTPPPGPFPPLPEEISLLLGMFQLATIARYDPAFLTKIRPSREWPTARTLTRHGLLQLMRLFCSFAEQSVFYLIPTQAI